MEETKLLRFLIILTVIIKFSSCIAADTTEEWVQNIAIDNQYMVTESAKEWAEDVTRRNSESVMDNFKKMMDMPGFDQALRDEVLKPRPRLQIFVSTSMPKQLVKNYAREAKHYGGVLVLRGFPGGSVHKLTNWVMEIADEDTAAMQIDDESFTAFNITSVPAIVLAKPVAIFAGKSQSSKFDKVTGSITIKGALDLFKRDGQMRSDAKEILR